MDRNEYTSRVLAAMRRVTAAEREAIRAELDAHMEDHMEALLELGYEPELAERRTLERMGDPEEVGRELDKQYPLRWLLLGRAAVVLMLLLCLQAFLSLGLLSHAYHSLETRIYPNRDIRLHDVEVSQRVDHRANVGNDVLRVYRISIGTGKDGERLAEVSLCSYDRIPCGIVSESLLDRTVVKNQRGEERFSANGNGCWLAEYSNRYVKVEPDDTYVTVEYQRFGERVYLEVLLPEEVTS